ncbi:metallo-dependent phosphatases family [Trichomonas vaginalis G3]|uniref:metallo-dependent phosphatases family n=1 Tax=Trichomonas vaginalis (strain ATCC PRA-98 / G3) TaxID=412133 RepID=UPI0021E57C75|nr:metallo-dependent phosphatases family [Trichomonas vaginalis G3]KAI5548462.1 metallo-dependent phosphatases family [Trichomonas vaginalis G3]
MAEEVKHLEPKCTHIKYFDIHLPTSPADTKIVAISDLHVGQFESTANNTPKMVDKIRELVEKVKPTALFILGDIIHFKFYRIPTSWLDFYRLLDTINIPIYVIPGNHDRYLHDYVKNHFQGTNVHLLNVEIMCVYVEGYPHPVIFGHDLKNDKKVHGDEITHEWIRMLRETFHDIIPDESLMVLGHLHDFVITRDKQNVTVLPFSCSLHCFMYTILTPGENGKFEYVCKFLKE